MTQHNEHSRQVIEFVEGYLEDFGKSFSRPSDDTFFTKRGSAVIRVRVLPWGTEDALVTVSSDVVTEAKLEFDLLHQLLRTNQDAIFGAFSLSENGTVTLRHSLFGSTMDRDELVSAIMAVARTADEWDDRIIKSFGGQTALDRLQNTPDEASAEDLFVRDRSVVRVTQLTLCREPDQANRPGVANLS